MATRQHPHRAVPIKDSHETIDAESKLGWIVPKYFFDITDAGVLTRDEFGDVCCNDDQAREHGISLLPEIARDALPDGDQHEFVATVRNEAGAIIYEASLTLDGRWWPGKR